MDLVPAQPGVVDMGADHPDARADWWEDDARTGAYAEVLHRTPDGLTTRATGLVHRYDRDVERVAVLVVQDRPVAALRLDDERDVAVARVQLRPADDRPHDGGAGIEDPEARRIVDT